MLAREARSTNHVRRRLTRRRFLVLAGASPIMVAACGGDGREGGTDIVGPGDTAVGARERRLAGNDPTVRRFSLTAGPVQLDLAGRVVDTWGYSGDDLRLRAGEVLDVTLRNDLFEDTTIHWHGVALRNDMDGVHDLTQSPVAPGTSFRYRFVIPDPGTYFFHPTPVCSSTGRCTRRSSSTTRTTRLATTPSTCSCSTTGSTARPRPPMRH